MKNKPNYFEEAFTLPLLNFMAYFKFEPRFKNERLLFI